MPRHCVRHTGPAKPITDTTAGRTPKRVAISKPKARPTTRKK